jgi:hypothetical protein
MFRPSGRCGGPVSLNTNIEQIVARLIQYGKFGGFHVNDSKYGDADVDTGAIDPCRLFRAFNEMVEAEGKRCLEPQCHRPDQKPDLVRDGGAARPCAGIAGGPGRADGRAGSH